MTDFTSQILDLLTLGGVLVALGFLLLALATLLVATIRVAILGRPMVSTFEGGHENGESLTRLFVDESKDVEQRWVALAREVEDLQKEIDSRSEKGIASAGTGASPRTSGDEFLPYVLSLDSGSIASADIWTISVGGVSFSPAELLALLRRVPGMVARRRLTGSLLAVGPATRLAVSFEQRAPLRRRQQVTVRMLVAQDADWFEAIRSAGFRLAKARIEAGDAERTRLGAVLRTNADNPRTALIEGQSWEACEAFLEGYLGQLRHYGYGGGDDRDAALEHYSRALELQPDYPRAAYNRGVLLYNRYTAEANAEALTCFERASTSRDPHLRALAYSGITLACAQSVHRFDQDPAAFVERACAASAEADLLEPDLEETRLAIAWCLQLKERWDEAIAAYSSVGDPPAAASTAGSRRLRSFARTNAAWILLFRQTSRTAGVARAEAKALLEEAVALYPNKIANDNLAAVAIAEGDLPLADRHFATALELDPGYAAAWNERAVLEQRRARDAERAGDAEAAGGARDRSRTYQAKALALTTDPATAQRFQDAFAKEDAPLPLA